ncbi:MAG: glycosyltransferase family 2 protein [Hyphomicrobiales bacterium]|nr:glycosyltransferase family 2 protein [Hyphomicrobiales bacterium]MCP5374171.1 glycosyltransferase family 2 protein [Hyphomicrobiales bacterium]
MITVLLATFNGARTLPATLQAMTRLRPPEGGWKLVVVDNNSRDDSRRIIEGFADRLPLTYAFEERRGKNAALNRGLDSVEGDLVVFTDDDTLPAEDWLCAFREAADGHPDHDVFAGRILPAWEAEPPAWVLDWVPLGVVYSLTAPDRAEGTVSGLFVWGPNMAVRAGIFAAGHRFDDRVGPDGSATYPMGSETEFVLRLERQGSRCWFVAGSRVGHVIPAAYLDRAWILGRATRSGRGVARLEFDDAMAALPTLFGYPRYLVREILAAVAAYLRAAATGDGKARFQASWRIRYKRAYAREVRSLRAGS